MSVQAPVDAIVDVSIRSVLDHRVGQERTDQLIQDAVDGVRWAGDRIGIAIGCWNGFRCGAHGWYWSAPLEDSMQWDGASLVIERALPETIVAALEGRRLGDLLEHRALPADRVIQSVLRTGDGLRLMCTAKRAMLSSLTRTTEDPRQRMKRRDREEADVLTRSNGDVATPEGRAAIHRWLETQKKAAHERFTSEAMMKAA